MLGEWRESSHMSLALLYLEPCEGTLEFRLGNIVHSWWGNFWGHPHKSVPPGIGPLPSHLGFLLHDGKESNKHIPGNLLLVPGLTALKNCLVQNSVKAKTVNPGLPLELEGRQLDKIGFKTHFPVTDCSATFAWWQFKMLICLQLLQDWKGKWICYFCSFY